MKTLLKLLVTTCFSLAIISTSFGGDDKMTKKDHIMMKDGKMMVQKDGNVMAMEKDMTLENGTVVKTDGTVTAKDGDAMTLKDGQAINMKGKMMKDHVKAEKSDKEDKSKTGVQDKRGDTKPE